MNDYNVLNVHWALRPLGAVWQATFDFQRYHGEVPFSQENFALEIIYTDHAGAVVMPASYAGAYGERVRDIAAILGSLPGIQSAWIRPSSVELVLTDPDIAAVARDALSALWGPCFNIQWSQDRRGGTDRRTVPRPGVTDRRVA